MGSPADRLCASFEVSSLHQAVELAAELRTKRLGTVRIRPARLRRLVGRRWKVTLTSAPGPIALPRQWANEMQEVARRRSGCRFVGVKPVPDPAGTRHAPVRVLVVDDSAPFRRAACELLARRGYVVVGEAETAETAIEATERLAPDAILLDVHLPDACGFELAAFLIDFRPGVAVLLTSADDALAFDRRAGVSGARGLVLKRCLATAPLGLFWPTP